jgi:hypothetical protein
VRRLTGQAAAAAVVACGLAACSVSHQADPGAATARPTVAAVAVASADQARAELRELRSGSRGPAVGYARDAFGTAWRDTEGNGCNQRDDVLLRDAVPGSARYTVQGACDHDVLAGTWADPYTGHRLTSTDLKDPGQAQALQIDHLVPLGEAWGSGADGWDAHRRERFANDLSELLAADGPTNASKGDDDPAAWRPRQAFQCTYAVRWIATKSRWDLAVDAPERRALGEMLRTC